MRWSGIPLPSVACGAVTSMPSFTRKGRPCFSFASRPPCGRTSTALRVSSAIPMRASLEAVREERRAGEAVAPLVLDCARDPDPRAGDELGLRFPCDELERRLVEREAVVDPR